MPPALAIAVYFVLLVLVFRHDTARDSSASPALWIPLVWMVFAGSRSPAQWLGLVPTTVATAFEEGSAFDRVYFLLLMGLALWVLAKRGLHWPDVIARNLALMSFVLFALISVIWSDYPFVAFKRWIRDLGIYLMALVVLSDARPLEAIVTLIRRLSYLLLFSSVVLVKYYPEIGILFNPWTGVPEYTGATTSKNMLGVVCLISGLVFFWDTLERWPRRGVPGTKRILLVNMALIAMTLWLLRLSQSATSQSCLIIGCSIIAMSHTKWIKANPRRLSAATLSAVSAFAVLEYAFDFSSIVAPLLGRDPTLTGRTGLWSAVLALQTNPVLGVGYQSFWLGDRMAAVARATRAGFLNEAHNGYLEIYLSLGLVGLALIGTIIISSYRTVRTHLTVSPRSGSLSLALWGVMLFYNFTEAAFASSLLWCVYLLFIIVVPRSAVAVPLKATRAAAKSRAKNYFEGQLILPDGPASR